jgi:hypothetical protein
MEGLQYFSYCKEDTGFPELLRDTLRFLQAPGTPEYYGHEISEAGTKRWMVRLHIKDNRRLGRWYAMANSLTFPDACQLAAREALQKVCTSYCHAIHGTPMRFFPPMDKTSNSWMDKVENKARRFSPRGTSCSVLDKIVTARGAAAPEYFLL